MKDHQKTPERDWRQYPIHAELLSNRERYQAMRDRCLQTCRELDTILRTGPAEQRPIAQSVLNAYGYGLELLEEAIRARDAILQNNEAS
ncbi:MAG: hypothetical protein R3E12_00125 [Candidatus Eisenbacteria bacterium]|uniref:Uncharacterized protein n=1 Tax=Eiseniibacteriota bacterium TaxID=2212470 RepID=A0A956RNS7_UNCEI|nr:hypothetical protein [Candidatus Eisenbacteria bacterium]